MRIKTIFLASSLTICLLAYARAVSVNTTMSGGVSSSDVLTFSSGTVNRITTSTGVFNVTLQLPINAAPQANVIPTTLGQLIVNTGATPDELCFSTATAFFSWVRVSTPTANCSN